MKTTEIPNPSGYDMPKPTRFLLLDDLSQGDVMLRSLVCRLGGLTDATNESIVASTETLAERLQKKIARRNRSSAQVPEVLNFVLGNAGERVANLLALETTQVKIHPKRLTDENGKHVIVSKVAASLSAEIEKKVGHLTAAQRAQVTEVNITDDTVFSGHTLKAVYDELATFFPNAKFTVLTLTHVPSMTLVEFDGNRIEIVAGLTLDSTPNQERGVNSVDARDFVEKDALPLTDGSSLAFSEEENWMRAWFGPNYEEAMAVIRALAVLVSQIEKNS